VHRTLIGLVAASLLFAIGCGDDDDDSGGLLGAEDTESTDSGDSGDGGDSGDNPADGDGYTDEIRDNFINSCTVQGTEEFCECTWDQVVQNVPYDDFVAYEQAVREDPTATPPQGLIEAGQNCVNG
jgi:hypothetical protein